MPGIFGLSGSADNSGAAATLERMASLLTHYPWYEEFRWVDEGAALGTVSLGFWKQGALFSNSDETLQIAMDGEIYDRDAQRNALVARGCSFRSENPAELLLRGFEHEGKAFLRGLHGKFVAAIWDPTRRRLVLVNDRFGMRPLYYAHVSGRLVFASEIKAVLADSAVVRDRNLRGVAQFFTYGQFLGEDTLLEGIRLLPAAGLLTYDVTEDRVSVEQYWRLEPNDNSSGKEERILDQIDHAFGEAVRRCTSGSSRLGLSLSGGLDARTILGAIDDAVPITTVSIGMEGSMDHRSAAEMARLANRQHHQCLLDQNFLANFETHLRRMVHITDGHYLSQCIVMPTLPKYRELGIHYLLRGHAGELMHMTKAYSFSLDAEAMRLRSEQELDEWLFRRLQTYMLEGTEGKLFAPRYREEMKTLARESLRECLRESTHLENPLQRIAHLFLTQRSRRETASSLVKFGTLTETRLPYLDNDLIDALFAAPPELKLDEKIQAHILRRRRPEFLRVPNVNTGAPMEAGRMGRFLGKYKQKIFAKLGVKGYQPYERLGLWLRRELRPLVQSLLLDDRCLGRGLFDPTTVKKVVHHHWNGGNHTFLILAMMTYEMGQRAFVDKCKDARASEATSLEAVG